MNAHLFVDRLPTTVSSNNRHGGDLLITDSVSSPSQSTDLSLGVKDLTQEGRHYANTPK